MTHANRASDSDAAPLFPSMPASSCNGTLRTLCRWTTLLLAVSGIVLVACREQAIVRDHATASESQAATDDHATQSTLSSTQAKPRLGVHGYDLGLRYISSGKSAIGVPIVYIHDHIPGIHTHSATESHLSMTSHVTAPDEESRHTYTVESQGTKSFPSVIAWLSKEAVPEHSAHSSRTPITYRDIFQLNASPLDFAAIPSKNILISSTISVISSSALRFQRYSINLLSDDHSCITATAAIEALLSNELKKSSISAQESDYWNSRREALMNEWRGFEAAVTTIRLAMLAEQHGP